MLRSCLIFFLKSVTVGIITNPNLNKHPFKSVSFELLCCLADLVSVELWWSFHVQVPWVLQNSIAWFCHGLCSCSPLWLFCWLFLTYQWSVWVDVCMTCVMCMSGFCIMPYVPFHIHLTMFAQNLVRAWTLHLRSSCTDVNTLKHFMHNSVIIITFILYYQVRYLDLGELSIFSISKSPASANLCC